MALLVLLVLICFLSAILPAPPWHNKHRGGEGGGRSDTFLSEGGVKVVGNERYFSVGSGKKMGQRLVMVEIDSHHMRGSGFPICLLGSITSRSEQLPVVIR